MEQFLTVKRYPYFIAGILVFLGLYLTSFYHYLLFHSLAEIFSIVVACGIFMIAWNSRHFFANHYLLFIGIAYLFVAGVDLIHTLAYKGMGIFQGYETNLTTQLWIATRYMVSLSFLIAPLLFRRKLKINLIFLGYIVATSILLLSIFYRNIFPVCFIEGVGLTPFKKISEYIICLILLASIVLLLKNRGEFSTNVFQWIVWSIIMTIASELAFTFYIHAYGFSNMVGHFSKILSFYFIYKAIVETCLTKPYKLLFRNLKQSEEALQNTLKETDQRRAEISALLEASRAVLENRKFKDAARAIFDSCKNLIGANAGYVALLTKEGTENEVLFLDSGGLRCTVDPNLPMPIRGLREEASRTGKAVFHNDFPSSGYMKYMPEGHVNLNKVLFAPLAISGKVIGLLGLANKPGGFTENDARMASALGELAAVALHNSRTLESLETSEEHFRSVVQTANDAIISIDKRGNIIFWNNSAENIFGYSAEEVTGKPLTLLMPERFRQIHQKAIHQVVSTGKSNIIGKTIEMIGLKKDGNEFPLELSLAAWGAGEEIFFTGILRSITQRKQAEDELRQKTHELGERVKELNCLYAFSNLIEKPDIWLPEIFQGLVDILPSGWQYPEMTCGRLVLEDQIFKTANFMETIWKQNSPILVDGRHIGDLEVYYLEGKPEFEEGPFLKDERNLIDALASRLGKTIKRIWAEEVLQKTHDELEQRVKERTAQLMRANEQLNQEMEEHKQVEEEKFRQHRRLEALWKITRNIDADYKTLYDMVLVEIIEMTQSRYGFYGFINEDESVMTIHSWSKEAMESCKISDKPIEFPIVKAGLWGEAVRKRKILIVNDYKGDHPGKKGIPEGHVSLTRILTVPVFSHGRIIALATISDKPTDYTEEDVEQINAFMTHLQVILERRQAEEALRESENRLRSLSSQLLTVQENERKRIAMELHDGIGQLLTAIKFKVENVLQEKGKARANEKSLEAIIPMVKESVEEIRRIQMDLRPSTLDDLGVLATLEWFCREYKKIYSHIHIEKLINIHENEVPAHLRTAIFRVMQEAMNNIAKYSKADLVHLSLQKTDGTIELAIQDNGQGFNSMEVLSVEGSKRGLGLTSMRERTELSGGSFVVESTRGRGTVIRALWHTG